ncbi:MAG: sulfur oxidation c-type cytochrome SoxX [Betaproteobacteria bacterium]|nr:sulfur oxidation c-type cytochrome SoxX [Betaproteobacteria bacterium]
MSISNKSLDVLLAVGLLTSCVAFVSDSEYRAQAMKLMGADFKARGQAGLDRLNQDEANAACSRTPADGPLSKSASAAIEKANFARLKYPADGKLLGDWREGERIAQSGVGKQFNDDPSRPAGANCYACHQLAPKELSFGTIGPSLLGFGKLRGTSRAIQEYTFGKLYNPQAYTACSNMPRFGHNGILTEAQIKDLVALLLDPESPVNK